MARLRLRLRLGLGLRLRLRLGAATARTWRSSAPIASEVARAAPAARTRRAPSRAKPLELNRTPPPPPPLPPPTPPPPPPLLSKALRKASSSRGGGAAWLGLGLGLGLGSVVRVSGQGLGVRVRVRVVRRCGLHGHRGEPRALAPPPRLGRGPLGRRLECKQRRAHLGVDRQTD
eukprot:scaffold89773_cov27-Phaeocystis_antarctica.AAC.1